MYPCYSLFVQRIKLLGLSHFIAAKGFSLDAVLQLPVLSISAVALVNNIEPHKE